MALLIVSSSRVQPHHAEVAETEDRLDPQSHTAICSALEHVRSNALIGRVVLR